MQSQQPLNFTLQVPVPPNRSGIGISRPRLQEGFGTWTPQFVMAHGAITAK
jgi:hypothetical protein